MRRPEAALPLRHALALGLLQGPAELLPVSSSAHTTLVPWFAGWPYAQLDGAARKSFELAVHAGAGLALALGMRGELRCAARELDRPRAAALALATAPPALAGLLLRDAVERRLGGPRSIAAGLVAGAAAMAVTDARRGGARDREDVRPADGLALGLAQALALAPGVSRSGATISAARARGFTRGASWSLSFQVALPVIIGASALEAARVWHGGERDVGAAPLVLGAGAAMLSTAVAARLLRREGYGDRALLPFALYRCLMAAAVLARRRRAAR